MTLKKSINEQIAIMDFVKIKSIYYSKVIVKIRKCQATYWEKIFPNNIPDKGLAFHLYKEL